MPENTVAKAHRDSSLTSKSKWVTPVIIVLVVGLFIISMVPVSYTHLTLPTKRIV